MSWEQYNLTNKFIFPILHDVSYTQAKNIHPLKQRIIEQIVRNEKLVNLCEELILFGSAISMKCHKHSDIDLAVNVKNDSIEQRNEISRILYEITNYNVDLVWLNDSADNNSKVYKNISNGVKLI